MHLKIACSVAVLRWMTVTAAPQFAFEREIDFQIIADKIKPKFGFEYVVDVSDAGCRELISGIWY
jgi:hypothetical protein